MSTLAELIHPFPLDIFLAEYWEKKHLYIPNVSNKLEGVFTYQDFSNYLNMHAHSLQFPEIRVTMASAHVPPSEYQEDINYFSVPNMKTKVSPKKLSDLIKRNASLVLSDVQEYHPKLQNLAHQLSEELQKQINITLFYSAHELNCFKNHCDPKSGINVQLEGQKKWYIFAPPEHGQDPESDKVKSDLKIIDEVVLKKGDMMYLPKGVWHNAYADGGASLGMTFTINDNMKMDFVVEVLESFFLAKLTEDPELDTILPLDNQGVFDLRNKFIGDMSRYLNSLDEDSWKAILENFKLKNLSSRGTSSYNFPFIFKADC